VGFESKRGVESGITKSYFDLLSAPDIESGIPLLNLRSKWAYQRPDVWGVPVQHLMGQGFNRAGV
jgi:hypothetical protein